MKTTRRFIAGLSAMTMAAAMAMSVSATEVKPIGGNPYNADPNNAAPEATVTYNVDPSYTVTIPTKVTLSDENDVKLENAVAASDVRLEKGDKIVVSLDKDNTFEVKNGDETITYAVYKGTTTDAANKLAAESVVAEFSENGSETLTFAKINKDDVKYAGTYTGTLTFGISVESAKAAAKKPDIAQADCTFSPSNGKSTLSNANITTAMEYSADNGTTWTDVTSDGSIASLAAGTVQIRVKETADKLAKVSKIRHELAENLTPFMIPEFIVKMPQIPLNTNGKPDMSRMPVVMKEGQAYERIG